MRRSPALWSFLADLVLVVVFTAIGRSTHHDDVFGAWGQELWTTAWPFVVALIVGWAVLRAWKDPLAVVRTGLGLWLITVAGGLALRKLAGGGTALPFVLVATAVVLVFLVGWRLLANAGISALNRRHHQVADSKNRALNDY